MNNNITVLCWITMALYTFFLGGSLNSSTEVDVSTEVDISAAPTVIQVSPPNGTTGFLARTHYGKNYDFALEFSHAMNTRLTEEAVTITDPDDSLRIENIRWEGPDLAYIKICAIRETGGCTSLNNKYQIGKKYSITITSHAESIFGAALAEPETLWYIPEPIPRINMVVGFQAQASGSFEMVDSLPDSISLGDGISPSIAQARDNILKLYPPCGRKVRVFRYSLEAPG